MPPSNTSPSAVQPATGLSREASWRDESLARGLDFVHSQKSDGVSGLDEALGSGACALDFNNDGWMDLYLVGGQGHTKFYGKKSWWASSNSGRLFRNDRGVFTDVTAEFGIEFEAWGMGCSAGDLNNDGYSDLVVTTRKQNYLLKNVEGRQFELSILDENEQWSTSVTFADVNNDGLLDIYVGNYLEYEKSAKHFEAGSGYKASSTAHFKPSLYPGSANQLWLNHGNWSFENVASTYAVQNAEGRTLAHSWLDSNRDGWLDLIVVNDSGSTTRLFINQEGKRFVPQEVTSRLSLPSGVHDIELIDSNQDGSLDLFFSSTMGSTPTLLRGDSAPSPIRFSDETWNKLDRTADLAAYTSWGTQSVDLNNNGNLDIVIANGLLRPDPDAHYVAMGQPDTTLISQADGSFYQTEIDGFGLRQSSRSLISIDIDNDGDLDLLITHNNDPVTLLTNHTAIDSWLGLDLRDKQGHSGRFQHVEFTTSQRSLFRYPAQDTFLGRGDHRLPLALADDETIEEIKVTWIDGSTQTLEAAPMNQYLAIRQGNAEQRHYGGGEKTARKLPPRLAIWQVKARAVNVPDILATFHGARASDKLALVAAVRQYPSVRLLSVLQEALRDNSAIVQSAGIQALRQLEAEYSYHWLESILTTGNPTLKCEAAEVFEHFFDEEEALIQHKGLAIVPLIGLLDDENAAVQACAIAALAQSKSIRATAAIELFLTETRDVELIRGAIAALGELRQKSSVAVVERYSELLPAESRSSLAKLKSNEQRASIPIKPLSAVTDSAQVEPVREVKCLNIEPEKLLNIPMAQAEALVRQCPQQQLDAWFSFHRAVFEPRMTEWITSKTIGPRMLGAVIASYGDDPRAELQNLFLTALANHDNTDARVILLEHIGKLPFSPAIEKTARAILANERLASRLRIAAGEVLIEHRPAEVLAHGQQLFNQ